MIKVPFLPLLLHAAFSQCKETEQEMWVPPGRQPCRCTMVSASSASPQRPASRVPATWADPQSQAAPQPCQLKALPLPLWSQVPQRGLCSFSNTKLQGHCDVIRQEKKNAAKITQLPLCSPHSLPSLTATLPDLERVCPQGLAAGS